MAIKSKDIQIMKPVNIKRRQYGHGGCRIYFERGEDRKLVVDGYIDERFALALECFVCDYFTNHPPLDQTQPVTDPDD